MVFESTDTWPSYEGQEREVPPPISSYGFQKLAVEYFARAAHEQYGLPYTIVRPFNCVGIGEMRAKTDVEIDERQRQARDEPRRARPRPEGRQGPGPAAHPRRRQPGPSLHLRRRPRHAASSTAMEHPAALNDDFNLSTAESTTVLELAENIWQPDQRRPSRSATCSDDPFDHDVQKRVPVGREGAATCSASRPTTSLDEMLDIVVPWVLDAMEQGLI